MARISTAAGYADYASNSATGRWIPELYSGIWVEQYFEEALVTQISTTKYNGEIKGQGDSVVIPVEPTVTTRAYTIGEDMVTETPASDEVVLTVSSGIYTNVTVPDIYAYQSHLDLMKMFARVSAASIADDIDTACFEYVPINCDSHNTGATAGKVSGSYSLGTDSTSINITSSNALQYVLQASAVLDEQNIPRDNRWIVIPPVMAYMLKDNDKLGSAAVMGGNESTMRANERALKFDLDGMKIYVSNNLMTGTDNGHTHFHIPFGRTDSYAHVIQMQKSDIIDSEKRFAKIIRNLAVWGHKVVKPEGIGQIVAYF